MTRPGDPLRAHLLILAGMLMISILRRPESFVRAQFFAESLPVFYLPTYFTGPFELTATPYAGYLHLAPRLLAFSERMVAPPYAPLLGSVMAITITVGVASFLMSDRLTSILPDRWMRWSLAGALIASPSVSEILAIDVNVQVYLSVYLIALALARPASTTGARILDGVGATLSGLSGPFALLFSPLFWWQRNWLAAIVTACGLVQLASILIAPGRPIQIPPVLELLHVGALRVNAAVFGSSLGSIIPAIAAIPVVIVLFVVALRVTPKRAWLTFAYAALVVAGGGIAVTEASLAVHARAGERFFLLPGLTVAVLTILGIASQDRTARLLAHALGALLVAGIVIDFRVPPFPDSDWDRASSCIGSATSCNLRVYPARFNVVWPGTNGSYSPPMSWPPD